MSDVMTVAQGIAASYTLTIRDSTGAAYAQYAGSETLAGSVRVGRDSPALFAPTLAWVAPVSPATTTSTITVTFAAADTSGLDVGEYLVQVYLADKSADLYEGLLKVTYSAGSASTLTTYSSYQDLLDEAPWIEKLQKATDTAGFAAQRNKARLWFEDLLHRHYRNGTGIIADFRFQPGVDFGGRLGVLWRDGRRSADLQDWLDAGGLLVTQQVKDACTYYAIALLCSRQVTPAKDDGGYSAAARKYYGMAEDQASLITAEVDTNGDGLPDIPIRLGVHDTLEG